MTQASPHIVVVGSLNMDLIAKVSRLPVPGETVLGTELYSAPGGKGANQAVAAARLGAKVQMIACIGADPYGGELKANLSSEGIDVSTIRTVEAGTGVALICVDDHGQNQVAVIPGANGYLTAEMIDGSGWTSRTWVLAQLEVPAEAVHAAFKLAYAHGAHTILNAAPAKEIPTALWMLTHLLVVNESEASTLSGRPINGMASAVAVAHALHDMGPQIVAVTLGADGAVIVTDDDAWHIPALPVTAVDATAAGDAWAGALAASLAGGADLVAAASWASVAGAVTVTRQGAQPSLPYLTDVAGRLPGAPAPRKLSPTP
jgi:ribokinase